MINLITELQLSCNTDETAGVMGQLISDLADVEPVKTMNKAGWVKLLRGAGMCDQVMHQWHIEFEASSPEAHQSFLSWLGIPKREIALIRTAVNSETQKTAGDKH